MNPSEHISAEDLLLLALGEGDRFETEAHLYHCAECHEELRRSQADLGLYAQAQVEPQPLPAGARDRFLQAVAREPRAAAPALVASPSAAPRSRVTVYPAIPWKRRSAAGAVMAWIGWGAAAALALLALGMHADRRNLRQQLQGQQQTVARLQADEDKAHALMATLTGAGAVKVNLTLPTAKPEPSARATYQQKTGTLLLTASNLSPLPALKVYELWLIPASGGSPIPAGTFAPDGHGNASMLVASLHGATAAKAFGVTIENVGGAATPTMPIVLVGAPA